MCQWLNCMESTANIVRLTPGPRAGHTAVRAGNYILIWGGYDEPVKATAKMCNGRRLVVVFNSLLVTQCYTEDSCRPAIIDSRQKQRSQISFHTLSFQKI